MEKEVPIRIRSNSGIQNQYIHIWTWWYRKNSCVSAAAKSLFPDAVNPYFQTFAETRNLKWYDGQPVIIWDNCMSSDLLRMFGRQKLFDILDTQPTDTKCKTNSGSVRLVNSINIINSIEPYDVFLDGLCKSKEDKDQVCKLFPIIMELHEDDYDILYMRTITIFSTTQTCFQVY